MLSIRIRSGGLQEEPLEQSCISQSDIYTCIHMFMEIPFIHSNSDRAKPSQMLGWRLWSQADLHWPSWCYWALSLIVETSQFPVWAAQIALNRCFPSLFSIPFLGLCKGLSSTRIRDTRQIQNQKLPHCPDATFFTGYSILCMKAILLLVLCKNYLERRIVKAEVLS